MGCISIRIAFRLEMSMKHFWENEFNSILSVSFHFYVGALK